MNHVVLTLLEATLTLYPADATDQPVLAAPIWTGVAAENLVIRDQWFKLQLRPTGRRFPRNHPLVAQYELSIARIWALPLSDLAGFNSARGRYVMDLVWREEETGHWHRQTYYGVTISDRTRESREIDREFLDRQVFDAEYYTTATGQGSVPELTTGVPLTVRYVSATENVLLYSYNPTTAAFTAVASTTNRGTLTYTPSDRSGTFDITFSGEEGACVQVLADSEGTTDAAAFVVGSPGVADLPRLEFYRGANRLGAITRAGIFFAPSFAAGALYELPSQFTLYSGGSIHAVLSETGFVGKLRALIPSDVSGLKLFVRSEPLALAAGATVSVWPDESGNGNHLVPGAAASYPPKFRPQIQPPVDPTIPQAFSDPTQLPAVEFYKISSVTTPQVGWFETAAAVLDPSTHCIFCVVMPWQNKFLNASLVVNGSNLQHDLVALTALASGASGDNETLFHLTATRTLRATYRTDAGATLNQVTSTDPVYPSNEPRWVLLEQELNATHLILKQDGVVKASTAVAGVRGSAAKYIFFGSSDQNATSPLTHIYKFGGWVRCVLVYEGVPTAAERTRIRNYLRRNYGPF